jgi:hypothetical protein
MYATMGSYSASPPPDMCRPYLVAVDMAVRNVVYRILGVSHDAQALDHLNCARRHLSIPAEFGGLNIPSPELDAEHAHYASFNATLANKITNYESESLGPMYRIVRKGLLNVATYIVPCAVQLRNLYATISTMGGVLESDLVVLTDTLDQDLSDYVGGDVEPVVSPY